MKKKVFIIAGALVLIATTVCAKNNVAKSNNSTVTINIERGIQALESDNTGMAMYYFEKELDENPQNGYAWHFVSITKYFCGEFNAALDAANTAIEYLPTMDFDSRSCAHELRGDIYWSLGDTTNAIKDYNQTIEFAPDNIDVYLNLAQLYYELGNYNMSSENFKKLLSIDKSLMIGYMGLVRNEALEGNHMEAIKHCDNAISIQQDYSPAYINRAYSYITIKKYDLAIDDILSALEIDQSDRAFDLLLRMTESHIRTIEKKLMSKSKQDSENDLWIQCLALVYQTNGDYTKAIEQYKVLYEMKNLPTITHRIAHCYMELGDYTSALSNIDISLKTDSANSEYIMEKADVLYELGRADEAISEMSKYISLDRTFFYGYYRRGFFKDNTADYNGAIEDYTIAIALEPTYAYAYLGRADMYKAKGEEELAYADYKKVIEIDTVPESGSCAQYAYLALGNKERAIEFMNGVIESDKNDAGNYYDAACLYARMGETKKALNMLETALHKGYRRFEHMEKDDDLENIRSTNEYKTLIKKYKL